MVKIIKGNTKELIEWGKSEMGKLEEIEELINSSRYEHRIILYRDNAEDIDIEGYVVWLISEVKRLQSEKIDLQKELLDEQTKVYWDDDKIKELEAKVKRLREGIKEAITIWEKVIPLAVLREFDELLEED